MPVRIRLLEFESKGNEYEEKEEKKKTHKRKQKKGKSSFIRRLPRCRGGSKVLIII